MTAVHSVTGVCIGAALFTDLVGFTEYTAAAGDRAAVGVLDKQTSIAQEVVDAYRDARIVKELGDGLLVWFASADDGLAGASSLLAAVERASAEGAFPLAMRMGLHHGEVLVRGDDLVGQTINIAARIAALAGPGELLVSDDVVTACSRGAHDFGLRPIGPVTVKGVDEPVWLQKIVTRS